MPTKMPRKQNFFFKFSNYDKRSIKFQQQQQKIPSNSRAFLWYGGTVRLRCIVETSSQIDIAFLHQAQENQQHAVYQFNTIFCIVHKTLRYFRSPIILLAMTCSNSQLKF